MPLTAAPKPVILLAYANDPADGYNYLRNLPEEARQVRAALEQAEAQGLCEFELRYNATLDDILGAFQHPKFKDRIAVFHYGGHADSYELLFQSSAGNLQRIDGRGFAAFLAEQRSLQLVFLNACTTEPQVESLLGANVGVVIATSQEVDDGVAAALAAAFYRNLARGDSIGSSYRQAVAALRAQRGDDPALFYAAGSAPPPDLPGEGPGDEAVDGPMGGSADEPTDGRADEAVDEAADRPADEAVDGPIGGSADEPTDGPANGRADAPAAISADSPLPGTPATAPVTAGNTPGTPAAPATNGAEGPGLAPHARETPLPATPTGSEAGGSASGGYWPWMLRTRPGAAAAIEWSLPLAVGDPLFGLPALPPQPLPAGPYQRALDYYTRDLAELFFGRSRQIRDLYQRVTAAGRSSIILYYGQSGVGKSSLLDAGLAPRLAATHLVTYARRDRTLGLLGTLHRQLESAAVTPGTSATTAVHAAGTTAAGTTAAATTPAETTPATPAATRSLATSADRTSPATTLPGMPFPNLAAAWVSAEQAAAKPLVLILDQVEEVFTRRNPDRPAELAEFAAALRSLDAGGSAKPAGVLLLGFRKERLAELETALRAESLDFAKVYLAPLDGPGIEEVFWGPVRTPRLAAKYGLTVEEGLPEFVAQDLTADPDSPVAPTLNILLRKLWSAATAANGAAPHFSVALYEQLRREGILLDDFLRQQIATLAEEQPHAVRSGFLLELWAQHTTDLGTAEQCTAVELHAAYGHRPDLDAVLQRSKELYVLADPTGDGAAVAATRLAHDTLAPLVRRAYAESTQPAQQARRLLDSRVAVWQGDPKALLDDTSLALVEKGLPGTRTPSPAEQELLAKSRKARTARTRNRQLLLWAAAAAALLLLAMLGLTVQSRADQQQANAASTQIAVTATIAAELNTAETARLNAQATAVAAGAESARAQSAARNLTIQLADARARSAALLAAATDSQRLAQLSAQQLTTDPVVSLHLALAALPRTQDQPLVPEAEYALRAALFTSRERKFITNTATSAGQIALRGNRVAVGGQTPAIYDIELNPQVFPLPAGFTDVQGLRWGNDGRLLGWTARDVWVTGGGEPLHFSLAAVAPDLPDEQVRCAEWQPSQQWVAICTYNTLYAWQPESNRVLTLTTELDTLEVPTEPRQAVWSDDGRYLAGIGARLAVWDSRAPRTPAQVFYAPAAPGEPASFAYWTPGDASLVAGWFAFGAPQLSLYRWQGGRQELEPVPLEGTFSADAKVEALFVRSPDDFGVPLDSTTEDGTAVDSAAVDTTTEDSAAVDSAALDSPTADSPTSASRLLLWSNEGLLALYSLDGRQVAAAASPLRDLNGVVLSPGGERIGGYSSSGAAAIWSLPDLQLYATLDAGRGFVAGSLTDAAWIDNATLVLADAEGVVQVAHQEGPFSDLAVVRLDGYSPADRLARALRLADGRLLTAGYADGLPSSLRIWQIDPLTTPPGAGLPAATDELCTRVHRAITLPAGLGRPTVAAWLPDDALLLADDRGQIAFWQIGGAAAILPADPDRDRFAFAPDHRHVLRYGNGARGQIWRLDNVPPGAAAAGSPANTPPPAWTLEQTLADAPAAASWHAHGLLLSAADGTVTVFDPTTRRSRAAPAGARVPGSILLDDNLLLALRAAGVELWQLGATGAERQLATWPAPEGGSLQLDDVSAAEDAFVYRALPFGPRYVLRLATETPALVEVWRSTGQHVDTQEAKLNPALPLLATLDDGVVAVVDLEEGRMAWQSTSVAALAQQSVRAVQWSTDGQYLITQAQPLQSGTVALNIGIWRWEQAQQRLVPLQDVPSSGLLSLRPDMTALLAGAPGRPGAPMPYYYPILTDTLRLQVQVEGSCLLPRPLSEEQQQAFMVTGQ